MAGAAPIIDKAKLGGHLHEPGIAPIITSAGTRLRALPTGLVLTSRDGVTETTITDEVASPAGRKVVPANRQAVGREP
jgi:hypothetical protein